MKTLSGVMMVIAKTPEPGQVKTRLCPPLTPAQACDVAWACLLDTLDVAAAVPASRHVLVLAGEPGDWIPSCFEVIAQRGDGLAARLAAAFTDVSETGVVIAMDTPQVTVAQLGAGLQALETNAEAVLGMAADGGYWLIGLRQDLDFDSVFHHVPMSTSHTGQDQQRRLDSLGLRTTLLPTLRDIDTIDDLHVVASGMPSGRLPRVVSLLT